MEKVSRDQLLQWLAEASPVFRSSYLALFSHGAQDFDAWYRIPSQDGQRSDAYSLICRRGEEFFRVRTSAALAERMGAQSVGSTVRLFPPKVPRLPGHLVPVVFADSPRVEAHRSAGNLQVKFAVRPINPVDLSYGALSLQIGAQVIHHPHRNWPVGENGFIECELNFSGLADGTFRAGESFPMFAWMSIVASDITFPTEPNHYIRTSTIAGALLTIREAAA